MTSHNACAEVASLRGVSLHYKQAIALEDVTLAIPAGKTVGFIGPDGVGKSSLLALLAGARAIQRGQVHVLGGDMAKMKHRSQVCPDIAYMPQGLGRNLYPTLSVEENLQFFARLFGHDAPERRQRIDELTSSTGLYPFLNRAVGNLSGGMKQKLGLCCALIHDPALLILDEPTTGIDPLARAQFWALIGRIRATRSDMSVVVATAYMEEAEAFDWLVAMDDGRVLATGTPAALLLRTDADTLEGAFISLLPPKKRSQHIGVSTERPRQETPVEVAIEAKDLTMRFGDFVAVDRVSFEIQRGEIFGFLGSNGCGKTTIMKMLTGLLPASGGEARLFGKMIDPEDLTTRRRVGYMSQSFSLYGELTVKQNLALAAHLFHVPKVELTERVENMLNRFDLAQEKDMLAGQLPLGIRQRLSLAVAMVHKPELLILDEPTSGVDPIARDNFWRLMIDLSRQDQVTIFISTHFMNEAARCDRISFMHAGRVLDSDTPANLIAKQNGDSLTDAFVSYLMKAGVEAPVRRSVPPAVSLKAQRPVPSARFLARLHRSLVRINAFQWRESLELRRDPVRSALALFGSLLLMFVIGYGINMDVENLRFAVLDRDQTQLSHRYVDNLSGSRYFIEQPSIASDEEMDRRMRSGEISLALEIPLGFARGLERGDDVQISAWIDGAMPQRAQTVLGYTQAMHQHWYAQQHRSLIGTAPSGLITVETRYRYNPDVKSLLAMVPAVIPLLLLMLPAMLTALAVVREKELGSIINFYVTPTSRTEFLLGKQLPYVVLAMLNFGLMCLAAVTVFEVPMTGSFATLSVAALLFAVSSTGMGLLASTITSSQIAAMFFTMIGTLIPANQFAGLINPVSSLEGAARLIGEAYPASHMFIISRGVFSKALTFQDLQAQFWPLLLAAPVIFGLSILLLRKQEK